MGQTDPTGLCRHNLHREGRHPGILPLRVRARSHVVAAGSVVVVIQRGDGHARGGQHLGYTFEPRAELGKRCVAQDAVREYDVKLSPLPAHRGGRIECGVLQENRPLGQDMIEEVRIPRQPRDVEPAVGFDAHVPIRGQHRDDLSCQVEAAAPDFQDPPVRPSAAVHVPLVSADGRDEQSLCKALLPVHVRDVTEDVGLGAHVQRGGAHGLARAHYIAQRA
mmetsp:Transcript_27078/g.84237  ORF Transcript_27078/g.84237 Transcript_27078/m.84237 type:complete len:221 (+) Transcript_27078:294-956(+)